MAKIQNTFNGGLNMDVSDFLLKNSMVRNCQNMRIVNLEGTSFAITNIPGNINPNDSEGIEFRLTTGYYPIAAKEYGGILYIVSATFSGGTVDNVELGSYPSPNYADSDINTDIWKYRPLNNLNGGAFNTNYLWDFEYGQFVDLELQPKYDNSTNLIITVKGTYPRIINSAFSFINDTFKLVDTVAAVTLNNYYDPATVDKETRLIMVSDKIMGMEFQEITYGGKLKPGNYQYVFAYSDENFNETDVVNQSSTCAVMFGSHSLDAYGGNEVEETNKKVILNLSNLDSIFKYISVYFLYSSGRDAEFQRLYKITKPYDITNYSLFTFEHTGYEDVQEVPMDAINVDYSAITSAGVACQAKNYLILGNITQVTYDWDAYAIAVKEVDVNYIDTYSIALKFPYLPFYVYNYMSEMRGETVPYGIIFMMKDGTKSPVFPVTGKDFITNAPSAIMQERGLIRFPDIPASGITDINGNTVPLGVTFNFDTLTTESSELLTDNTLGFFIVRGDRREDAIGQGYLIPTFRAPLGENADHVTSIYDTLIDDVGYASVPILDGILEGYLYLDKDGDANIDNALKKFAVSDINEPERVVIGTLSDELIGRQGDASTLHLYNRDKWALYSTNAILNEPEYITKLSRTNIGLIQIGKVFFTPTVIPPTQLQMQFDDTRDSWDIAGVTRIHYVYKNITPYTPQTILQTDINFVQGETQANMHGYTSKYWSHFRSYQHGTLYRDCKYIYSSTSCSPYFGVDVEGLTDSEPGLENPIGAATRNANDSISVYRNGNIYTNIASEHNLRTQIDGNPYVNTSTTLGAAFLVNIYPRPTGMIDTPEDLYFSIDGIMYRQVGIINDWNTQSMGSYTVYGGDTYISKITTRLYQPGSDFRDPALIDNEIHKDVEHRRNINMGILLDLMQESKYNPMMRIPYIYDNSDLEKRTFYPVRTDGDALEYREYRYPDTSRVTIGSNRTETPKVHFTIPEQIPLYKFEYFTRLAHSKRHALNVFGNNYRVFEGVNFRDYDVATGSIVRIVEYRDNVVIIFEHGIAIVAIEQRIQTGSDVAGSIFVEPKSVLPPHISFYSKEIGSQHAYSVIRTPGAIYGFDIERQKMWKVTDKLEVISDTVIESFLAQHVNPKSINKFTVSGYDPQYHEVFFTYVELNEFNQVLPDNTWTIVYKEGRETYSYFYTGVPYNYARRRNEFYQFGNRLETNSRPQFQAFKQNNGDTNYIFGNLEDAYVEFVINESPNFTKVIDYLEILSNEVVPTSIELFSYDKDVVKYSKVIDSSKTFQYIKLVQHNDIFTEEPIIKLRDRKFVVQIPNVDVMKEDVFEHWMGGSRLRNKVIMVRLTYNTEDRIELLAVISNYRKSNS